MQTIPQKTPITYYGGKQKIAKWVISHFPKHESYIEPFAGGLAVFFAKLRRAKIEVINDLNSEVYNFYLQYRENPSELIRALEATPYSLEDYEHCKKVYKGTNRANDLERARAFFICANSAFGGVLGRGWSRGPVCSGGSHFPQRIISKVNSLKSLSSRLRGVYIENKNALDVIKYWDREGSFFYLDPPYPETDQGHYSGYSINHFNGLLSLLKNIKGKFLLSCYLKDGMNLCPSWATSHKNVKSTVKQKASGKETERTETLIYNY